ncbi:hypothetical protein QFZ83_001592 [Variovorax sp. W1I1]|uniref:polysaccharide pyruvyl transferase family protein n=1 Tax=Variovorax sp. W1I1 TaxID=3042309 RepID=UPI00278405BF|nr:polysaccharide pyruvyl transferase family protein [Variovorax sp. W1I1]MDQ0607421.1 hypothetical protein [Variovorax sp. W1I1]
MQMPALLLPPRDGSGRHLPRLPEPAPMPQVGVLTFHRCINYGSYWQARCLAEGLRGLGYRAVVLDHRSRRIDLAEWRCALQPAQPGATPPADRRMYARKTRRFLDAIEALPLTRPFELESPQDMPRCDAVVVGSDEVWNFAHPWFRDCPPFFGEGLRAGRLVAYAASFGNHPVARGVPPHRAAALRRFDALSVRDGNSRALIAQSLGDVPALVLDPCLQFASALRPPEADGDDNPASRCIALYGHNFSGWFAERVRAHARRHGLHIVSIGYRNDWADVQWLTAGPEDFARFMALAGAVATNFFHGCVFALRHGKPFVCEQSPYRAIKIDDLLVTLGARRHLVDAATAPGNWEVGLSVPVAAAVHARIAALRATSMAYLQDALAPLASTAALDAREARRA